MKASFSMFAGRLERFFAGLLDLLAVLVISIIMGGGGGLGALVAFACIITYYIVPLASNWQASVGQRLLSMYVVRVDGRPIDRTAALVRFLAFIMPWLPLYTSLLSQEIAETLTGALLVFWFAPILFTPDRAGIHDQLSSMRVVMGKVGDKGKQQR